MRMTHWFRRHQRYLLAGLVVMLMVAWGVLGTVQNLVGRAQQAAGTIHGESVGPAELQDAYSTLRAGAALGLLEREAVGVLQFRAVPPRAAAALVALSRDLADFVFAEGRRLDRPATWRTLVVLKEADAAGVEVTQDEAAELLSLSPVLADAAGVDRERFESFLSHYGISEPALNRAVMRLARVGKLLTVRRESFRTSAAELWMSYAHNYAQRHVRYVAVDASLFEPLAEAGQQELRDFYAEHRDRLPDPAAGLVGYMAPQRVRVEYAAAPIERLTREAEVSDDEVAAYYAEHRDEFIQELDEAPEPPQEDAAEEGDEGPAEGFRYQALEEAEGAIRDRLKRQKALDEADALARRVLDELDEVGRQYANEPLPLAQMARRHGLSYAVAATERGSELLWRDELAAAVPRHGQAVADFIFDEGATLYYPEAFGMGREPVICQLLERREAEPRPFEEVAEQVRRDYARREALARCEAFAGKLLEQARQEGLQEAAAEMERRLRSLLGGAAPAEQDEPLLELAESEPFARAARTLPGMAEPHPKLVEAAFAAAVGELALATEGEPVGRCYVLQVAGQEPASREEFAERGLFYRMLYGSGKQDQAMRRWLEGLLSEAHAAPPPEE